MSHWGIGVYHPKTAENIGTLWRAAHLYGASHIFTIGARYKRQVTDTSKAWRSIPLFNFEDFDDFAAHRPFDAPLVGIELSDRAVPLAQFGHPRIATYLLGAEDHGLPERVIDACQHVVQIEAVNSWSMNVAMAGSLVAYDRHVKSLTRLAAVS
jgi:tRNA(Leu) C34 or U34 (ribose-2'-O)-methylase TrmL